MEAALFEFPITDFEEVYTVIDKENMRLHISSVNYHYNITLDLTADLHMQLEQQTKWGEVGFNNKVKQVVEKIIEELNLSFKNKE